MTGQRSNRLEPPDFAFPIITTAAMQALVEHALPPTRITVISAPTGYGKTTLQTGLFQHLKVNKISRVWVGLDDRDRETEHVLRRLELALVKRPELSHPPSAVHQSDTPVEDRVEAIVSALAEIDGEAVLFIDNFNYCDDDSLRPVLDALIERTPASLHFVLAGTALPPLTSSRLKMQGQYAEYGMQQLAMGEAEVAAMLGEDLLAQLKPDAPGTIQANTEGWPAAVRLVQIILDDSDQPQATLANFSGSDSDLADMLNRQLLERLSGGERDFLLQISGLHTLSAPLCAAATGDDDAPWRVGELVRRNMLIIPVDRNRVWYRLHGLFREFLQAEARRTLPADELCSVLSRAAKWFERNGQVSEAIDHGMRANDHSWAAELIERSAATIVRDQGDLNNFIAWVEQLREAGAEIGAETNLWFLWALVFQRRYESAARQLKEVDAHLQADTTVDAAVKADRQRRLDLIRITIFAYTDSLKDCEAAAAQWLKDVGDDDPFDVATVACAGAIYKQACFDFSAARDYFRHAHSKIHQADSSYGRSWAGTLSTMVTMLEGDYATALDSFKGLIGDVNAVLGTGTGIESTMSFVGARCAVETVNDELASQWLTTGLRRAEHHGITDSAAHGLEAAVKLWGSGAGKAIKLEALRDIAASYPPRLSVMLSLSLINRFVRLGRVDDAMDEAARIGIQAKGCKAQMKSLPELPLAAFLAEQAMIELDIAGGRVRDAEPRLEAAAKAARDDGRWGHATELALSAMTISLHSINAGNAARHLTRAITYAAKRGYKRAFLDRAESIAGLVNETKPQSWGFALDEERAFFNELCSHLPIANSALLDQLEQLDVDASLLENPTPREMELLQLIEAGLSNQQLADRLSVSVATVKWHLYNLYGKLSVSSRSAAVAKARALNLLSN